MAEIVKKFEPEIEKFVLIPSEGGRFEVSVNQKLLYSKLATHRHAEPGEVARLIQKALEEGV